MSVKEEFFYNSRDMKTKIHAVKWIPEGEIKAVLQIAHGMDEYIERYEEFAGFMADNGFLVVGNDHLGHGKTAKTDEDFGYFCERDADMVIVRDVHRLKKKIQEEHPTKPYFLLGHSMGSFIVRKYMTLYGSGISGILLLGTGNRKMSDVNTGIMACKVISMFKGEKYRSEFVKKNSFKGYNSRYQQVRTPNDWLTRDEAVVDKYNSDKMCSFTFTCNAYLTVFKIIKYINKKENLDRIPKKLPVFIASGMEDPVGGYGREVEQVYNMLKETGISDVVMKLYPNDRHELLNELDKQEVYNDIKQWLDKKVENLTEIKE